MKTITQNQFRVLLTLSIAMMIASVFAGVLADRWLLPESLRDYRAAHPAGRPTIWDFVIGVLGMPGLIGGFVSIIGLYRFWPCARWLAVAAWIYMIIWMPFSPGAVIENPLTGALSACSMLLAGAVLAISYFSPAADWFQRKA